MKLRLKRWIRAAIFLCALAIICCVGTSILYTQQVRLATLGAKVARLEEEKQKAQVKLDGMERMVEYSKSDEYIEQQARSILGWVRRDEILFVDSTEETQQNP